MSSTAFNFDFNEANEQELISIFQESQGCFSCREPGPTKKCALCKIAVYCDKQCQIKDWKKPALDGGHKEPCRLYCENRGSGPQDDAHASVPICMKSCEYISDDIMLAEMRKRGDSFLNEIRRCADSKETGDGLHFAVAVIYSVVGIHLAAAASFYSTALEKVVCVNHVLFESIDEGEEAKRRLYHSCGGAGEISRKVKALVVTKLTDLVERVADRGLHVISFTYGRGLMWLSDDEAKGAKENIEESNGEVNGVHRRIIWTPSMDYDVVEAAAPGLAGMMNLFGQM